VTSFGGRGLDWLPRKCKSTSVLRASINEAGDRGPSSYYVLNAKSYDLVGMGLIFFALALNSHYELFLLEM
jgi:hypothetical protein